jgi:Right handed beta helix region
MSGPVRVFSPPPWIASNCSEDVTIPLWDWLYTLPLGSLSSPVEVDFAQSGCYQIDGQLWLRGFTDTTFNGNGATFKNTGAPTRNETAGKLPMHYPEWCVSDSETTTVVHPPQDTYLESDTGAKSDIMFDFEGGCDITLENMNIEEQNTTPTTRHEVDSAIQLNGTQRVLIRDDSFTNIWGDWVTTAGLVEVEPGHGIGYPTTDVTIQNDTFDNSGRDGFGLTEGNRILITDNTMSGRTPQDLVDMEADWKGPTIANVAFVGNQVSARYGWILASLSGATEYNIDVQDNSFTGSSGMRIRIGSNNGSMIENVLIAHNTATHWTEFPWPNFDLTNVVSAAIVDNDAPVLTWQPGDSGAPHPAVQVSKTAGVIVANNQLRDADSSVPGWPFAWQPVTVLVGGLKRDFECGNVTSANGNRPADGTCEPFPKVPASADLPLLPRQIPS